MSQSNFNDLLQDGVAVRATEDEFARPVLGFLGVSKSYPGVQALSDVSLEILTGEVHAIVGENGAGKSTLMGVASGAIAADAGEVTIAGSRLASASPTEARRMGLAICRQTPTLMPDLTIAENLAIVMDEGARPRWGKITGWATEALQGWALEREIDPRAYARSLSPAARFMVEISKAINQNPRVLLLDEPTEALGLHEIEILFASIRDVVGRGTAVVYISHRIPDVLQISDRVSVLRDGVLRGTYETATVSEAEIVRAIVGTPLELSFPAKREVGSPATSPALQVRGLSGDRFSDVSFAVLPGEILGISGVEGNGQAELIRALAGLEPNRGEVMVDEKRARIGTSGQAQSAGLVYMPADRHAEGILHRLGVRENITASTIAGVSKAGFVSTRRERAAAAARVRDLGVKAPSLETPINSLSGGNQQKAVFARALMSAPRVILAHEPTQGVDVGSRLEIYRILREHVEEGAAVVVVSSDAAELEGLCDRVLVMSRGRVARELTGDDVNEERMTEVALTATAAHPARAGRHDTSPLRRFMASDLAPAAGVLLVTLLLGLFTHVRNDFYLTSFNFNSLLSLFAILAFAAMAHQMVMITGGIDLSVGPLMSFLLVVGSFWLVPEDTYGLLLLGGVGLLALALVVAVLNWIPTLIGVPTFVVTLVTFTALQGLALYYRPSYGGTFHPALLDWLRFSTGWVPWAAAVAVLTSVVLEISLRKTKWGAQLRAVGSAPEAAHDAGIRVNRVRLIANFLAAVLVVCASLLLMAQVGAGDARVGIGYTLSGITAVIIGGASIFGGRGSFVGAVAGALLIQQINTSTVFLGLEVAWQSYLLGGLTLVAAGLYSRARGGIGHAR